jgi:hypothetical protein
MIYSTEQNAIIFCKNSASVSASCRCYKQFDKYLGRTVKLFRQIRCIRRKKSSGGVIKRTLEEVGVVEGIMENEPKASLRCLSQQVNTSVQRIITKCFIFIFSLHDFCSKTVTYLALRHKGRVS